MSQSRPRNPMQAHSIDVIGVDSKIDVDESGEVEIQLGLINKVVSDVKNELEATAYLDLENLPDDPRARHAIYTGLLTTLDRENGKHYIVMDPAYSGEFIAHINSIKTNYTDSLVKNTNLVFSILNSAKERQGLSESFELNLLTETDIDQCAAVARFQKSRLIEMRPSLPDAAALKKIDERYSEAALIQKVQSGKIMVFSLLNAGEIIATMVINRHSMRVQSLLDHVVYMSDLLIDKKFAMDSAFIENFMMSVLQALTQKLSPATIFTFMAPGSATDPLVQCVTSLKEAGLMQTLDRQMQKELGLVCYFVLNPSNKLKVSARNTPANLFYYNPAAPSNSIMPLLNKTFIWDVGAVILHWDAKEFLTHYQAGRFLPHYQDIFGDHWKSFDRGDLSFNDMLDIYQEKLHISREAMRAFMQAVFHSLKPNWPVIHLIQQLKQYGHKHYCLTNGSQEYFDHVNSKEYREAYGFALSDLFHHENVVLSAPLRISKPEQAIYQHTTQKFNITGAQVIFVDDSAANIAGAKIAKWKNPIHYVGYDDLRSQIENALNIDLGLDDLTYSAFGQASTTAKKYR